MTVSTLRLPCPRNATHKRCVSAGVRPLNVASVFSRRSTEGWESCRKDETSLNVLAFHFSGATEFTSLRDSFRIVAAELDDEKTMEQSVLLSVTEHAPAAEAVAACCLHAQSSARILATPRRMIITITSRRILTLLPKEGLSSGESLPLNCEIAITDSNPAWIVVSIVERNWLMHWQLSRKLAFRRSTAAPPKSHSKSPPHPPPLDRGA